MNTPFKSTLRSLLGCSLASLCISVVLPAEPPSSGAQPSAAPALSKEQREKLATLHEQMAACLRSDKSLGDCRTQMWQGCRDAMGSGGCQGMGMGHGMMGPGMMGPGAKSPTAPSSK